MIDKDGYEWYALQKNRNKSNYRWMECMRGCGTKVQVGDKCVKAKCSNCTQWEAIFHNLKVREKNRSLMHDQENCKHELKPIRKLDLSYCLTCGKLVYGL